MVFPIKKNVNFNEMFSPIWHIDGGFWSSDENKCKSGKDRVSYCFQMVQCQISEYSINLYVL